MKISFVIPAYNEESYISDCLNSVIRELGTADFDTEIIVVNNASTDRTKEVAASFPNVRVVDETRKGLVFARKAGYEASTGMLIANVDADTKLPKGWIKKVLKEFAQDDNLVALSGPFIYYDLPPLSRFFVKLFYIAGYIVQSVGKLFTGNGAMLQGGNFIVRRDALEKIGSYDTSIVFYGEDTDIARRISRVGKVKWTFTLPMYASARRLKGEGVIHMGIKYAINYIWTAFTGKPYTKEYKDIRTSAS